MPSRWRFPDNRYFWFIFSSFFDPGKVFTLLKGREIVAGAPFWGSGVSFRGCVDIPQPKG
jgi:hypothetical protein